MCPMISILETGFDRTLGKQKKLEEGNPFDGIPVKDRKNAKETVEVYLGRRGIQVLVNFELFPNLEVVWLNDNKLKEVQGLDTNFRIKELYLHDNHLKTLSGSIPKLLHLRKLTLYNNELSDLDTVLGHLKPLGYLQHLELFENPLAEEQNYRKRLVAGLTTVQVLDRHGRFP